MNNYIFCNYNKFEIITENELAFADLDKFPINKAFSKHF